MKPHSSGTPLAFQQLQWILNPTAYLQSHAKRFGPIFKAMSDRMPVVFVSDPAALKQIFTNEKKQFSILGEANRVLLPLIGPSSVLMISGEGHRERRQLLMPAFHQESMKYCSATILRLAAINFTSIESEPVVSMREVMQSLSLQVIEEVVFGLDTPATGRLRQEIAKLTDMVSTPAIAISLFLPWLQHDLFGLGPFQKLQKQIATTDKLLLEAIESRRQQPERGRLDILTLLLAARDEQEKGLSNKELRDELTTMLLAGHETTATAMTWAVYHICTNAQVKAKLLDELDTLPQNADPMQIIRLPYLSAVCNEIIRLSTVVLNTAPRQAIEPVNLAGYSIDKGTFVVGSIYLLHQREDLYPAPDVFRPERFIENTFSIFEFMPFGGGSRRCLGEILAQFEMRLVLAYLFKNFDLQLENKKPEVAARRVVTLAPSTGVRAFVRPRT